MTRPFAHALSMLGHELAVFRIPRDEVQLGLAPGARPKSGCTWNSWLDCSQVLVALSSELVAAIRSCCFVCCSLILAMLM